MLSVRPVIFTGLNAAPGAVWVTVMVYVSVVVPFCAFIRVVMVLAP